MNKSIDKNNVDEFISDHFVDGLTQKDNRQIIKWKGNWLVADVKNQPNYIFVYGDNDLRRGKGGQAIIRDLPNTIGLRTKRMPSLSDNAFYTDQEFSQNKIKIDEDIAKIKDCLQNGKIVVFSQGGYGTGLAKLDQKAPQTFQYLQDKLSELERMYTVGKEKNL